MSRCLQGDKGSILIPWCASLFLAVFHPTLANASAQEAPINVIFDTDIWSDIDDVLALAMLHALDDRGEINLLAVTISTNDHWCASYVNLINTFYNHPQIPIGITHEGMDAETFHKRFQGWPLSRYTQSLSERKTEDGNWKYPHQLSDGTTAPDAVKVLRQTLAAQADGSVVIIQVGYSTNLARLLKSVPDSISDLDGRSLVARKVRLLSTMGGSFQDAQIHGMALPRGTSEFNLQADTPAAQTLFESWPTSIVISGMEVGVNLLFPPESIEHDFRYVHDHPIVDTYRQFCEELKPSFHWTCPQAQPTFDLTAVLYAVRPDRNYFSLSKPGKITVLGDGRSQFEETPGGQHRYLVLLDSQKTRTLEAMVMLTSQPPTRAAQLTGTVKN